MSIFKLFVVLVLCVVGLGFYRGWFVLSSQRTDAVSNKVDVNLSVDPDKAKADARAVEAKARGLTGSASEESTDNATKEGTPPENN
jgi:hypothetical protein